VPAKGVVHIAHGMGEHCWRYGRLAEHLTTAGLIVYSADHRGHARTAERAGLPLGVAISDEQRQAGQDGFLRMVRTGWLPPALLHCPCPSLSDEVLQQRKKITPSLKHTHTQNSHPTRKLAF
jgi:hypothetical protein